MSFYFIILLACLILASFFVFPLVRFLEARPEVVVGVTLLLFVVSTLFSNALLPPISVAGINVYPMDIICLGLIILAFPFCYERLRGGFDSADIPLLIFLVWALCIGVNYLMGLREFGLQTATNEFRGTLYAISLGLYVSVQPIARLWPKVEKMWLFAAILLFFIAIVGLSDGDLSRQGRPIGSSATLFMLFAVLLSLFMYDRGVLPSAFIPFCVAMAPMIILLQHRSVWVVGVFSAISICVLLPRLRPVLFKWGAIGLIVFGGLAAVLFGEDLFEALESSYVEAVSTQTDRNTSTFVWRLQTWTGLLTGEQMSSIKKVLIGNPFGTGWERVVMTSDGVRELRTESPHNFYLQTLLRGGVIGLCTILLLFGIFLRQFKIRSRMSDSLKPIFLCIFQLFAGLMLYYIVYGSGYIEYVLIGAGIAWLRETHYLTEA